MSFKIFHILSAILVLYLSLSVFANQEKEENYFLPNFRSGHNISLLLSGEYTTWSANQTSFSSNTDYTPDQIKAVTINSAQENKTLMALFFRYTYHINIISSFGFFVGSTVGVITSNGSYGKEKNFYPGIGISFPSVLGGLVQEIGQNFRFLTGIEYGAVWFPEMKIYTQSKEEKELSPSPDMYGIFIGADKFLTRNTAISINFGYHQITSPCLNNCSSSIYLNSLSLTSKSYYTQLGITWLIGELGMGR